jgi:tRNA modification GTPase
MSDTIAAISSVLAPATRIIVRLSGLRSHPIALSISNCESGSEKPSVVQTVLRFNKLAFPAWVYTFHAPHSYTGEDAIEFHIPGSPVLAKLLLDELFRQGARAAEPGEFTARAFFNGKLGLTQAEGVAATIAANNQAQLRAARQLLAGELTRRLTPLTESLAQTLALIEVGIDFTEEDVSFLASDEVTQRILDADEALADLLQQSGRFEQLSHETQFVLAGRPNAGKSALINALAGKNRAVVSSEAGTTRDVLSAQLMLPSGQVQLADIAGLVPDAQGHINAQMQQHAIAAIVSADYLLCVRDCMDDRPPIELPREPDLIVLTKSDLTDQTPQGSAILVSSKTGQGMDVLRGAMDRLAFASSSVGATLTLNRRHLQAVNSARESLARAAARVTENAPELVAMDLRDTLDSLGSIVGQVTPDDILGRVFSSFCIGK